MRSVCGLMLGAATRRLEAGGSTFKFRSRHPMVVFRATCAVRVQGAFGRGGLAACKARPGQLCSCVRMVQRMTFRALSMVRVQDQSIPGIRHARGAECCQLVGNTHDSPLCVTKH